MKKFEEEKKHKQLAGEEMTVIPGAQPIELNEQNTVFRPIKGTMDTLVCNPLTLKIKSSMNYVFLPVKESNDVIQELSFLHSAVPKIKLFLFYIRTKQTDLLNLPFFISVMELLKGMVYFILEIKDSTDYEDPFKCEGYPNQQRQKFIRETRLLDLLIDCLIFPFESGLYEYPDLTQQHPITRICQLVYRVLLHSVKENVLNKNYVAQWIDLFFK